MTNNAIAAVGQQSTATTTTTSHQNDHEFLIWPGFCGGDGGCGSRSRRRSAENDPFIPSVPKSNPTVQDADALMVEQMNSLSMEDQQRVFQDLHGIGTEIVETETLIENSLQELEQELVRISKHTAYEQARQMNPFYVENYKFRLMFLRADLFQPKVAAHRMIRFFEEKLLLFGPNKLTSEITLNDLTEEEISFLHCGVISILPSRDRNNRPILYGYIALGPKDPVAETMMRMQFYLMTTLAREDEIAQKKGIMGIMHGLPNEDRSFFWKTTRSRHAMPIRFAECHVFYNDPRVKHLLSLVVKLAGSQFLARFQTHYGTNIECIYKLMAYGISPDEIPVEASGKYRFELGLQWIRMRQALESSSSSLGSTTETTMTMTMTTTISSLEGEVVADQLFRDLMNEPLPPDDDATSSLLLQKDDEEDTIHNRMNMTSEEQQQLKSQTPDTNSSPSADSCLIPQSFDVSFGKGKGVQDRPGNVRFRLILDMHMQQYESAQKFGKTAIAERIIRLIHKSGGRFLKPTSNGAGWEEVDELTARDKVARAFRGRRAATKGITTTTTTTTNSGGGGSGDAASSSSSSTSSILSISQPHRYEMSDSRSWKLWASPLRKPV